MFIGGDLKVGENRSRTMASTPKAPAKPIWASPGTPKYKETWAKTATIDKEFMA